LQKKFFFAESLGKFSDLKFEYLPRTHAQVGGDAGNGRWSKNFTETKKG